MVHRGTILVLEDEPLVLAVLRAALQKNGFVVLAAENADAAVCSSGETDIDIDLIAADIRLPGASGIDAVLRIRAFRPNIPVLFTSGTPPDCWTTTERQQMAELEERCSFLQKPFTVQELKASVEELMSRETMVHTV